MFLDIAYLLRKLLNDHGHQEAEVVGLFYLPAAHRDTVSGPSLANAFAALSELQHYCQPNALFSAQYETAGSSVKGERVNLVGPAFQRCVLLPLPEIKGKLSGADNSAILARAGEFLYRDLATTLGQAIDEQRLAKVHPDPTGSTFLLQSVGMSRIVWPRHRLLEECARRMCVQLVTHWMNKDAKPMADTIRQWTGERWESLGLRPENLDRAFQQLAEQALQQKPESVLAEILTLMQQQIGAGSDKARRRSPWSPWWKPMPVWNGFSAFPTRADPPSRCT